jgi:uncharacterized protein (DUF2249 family)
MAHGCNCAHHDSPAVLDVTGVPPKFRHPMIFEMFDSLPVGSGFVLVNDHDPKPLFYQFQHERPGAVGWRYLEDGPDTWRVEISKRPTDAVSRVDAGETVDAVRRRSPQTDAVFERFGIDRCCGGRLTLREAAASAGVAVETVIAAIEATLVAQSPAVAAQGADTGDVASAKVLTLLRRAVGEAEPGPAAPGTLRTVVLDVRDDIRRGVEPFTRIMAAAKHLGADEALLLRAPFEPIPLYGVLGKRGLAHRTERHAPDDWSVLFYRRASTPASASTTTSTAADVVDVRGLEPPEPMVRVLERAEELAPGQTLIVVHDRRPLFLYPQLEARGFAHETIDVGPGEVRITIRRPQS